MREPKVATPDEHPDGLMFSHDGETYYVKGGKRYRVFSPRVIDSWNARVHNAGAGIKSLPLVKAPLGFRDGTLIHNYADGRLYLISGNKRRHITSPDVLKKFGWKYRDALIVSQQEADLHEQGDVLT